MTIPERPGSFRRFCSLLGQRMVTEFNYRLDDPKEAHIFVGLEIQKTGERRALLKKLRAAGLATFDLTDDEMSKLHIRHLVGGRAAAANEVLYRFGVSGASGRADEFFGHARPVGDELEHQFVSLPQQRRGRRPCVGRNAGAARRAQGLRPLPKKPRLPPPARIRQPRLPPVFAGVRLI